MRWRGFWWEAPARARRSRRSRQGAVAAGIGAALAAASITAAGDLPEVSAHSPGVTEPSPASVARELAREWEVEKRNDHPRSGWVVYKRRVTGSEFEAFRLEAVIDAPPALVAASFRKNIADPDVGQRHTEKSVLRDDAEAVVVYSYIDMPLVSDRDVISRCERDTDPGEGAFRYRWFATDEGPPPQDGVVRLEKSDGSWEFRPLPGEGGERTFAVYESHTDIGGSIPAWLVNRLMLDTVVDAVDNLRAGVDRDLQQVASGQALPVSESR